MTKRKKKKAVFQETAPHFENGVEVSALGNDKGPAHIWDADQIAREDLVLHELQASLRGRRVNRAKRVDNVERLFSSGRIDQRMFDAGQAFKQDFYKAQLGGFPEPKFEYSSPVTGERDRHMSVEKSRNRVRAAIDALGGPGTQASKAVWNFIGLEQSIQVVAGKSSSQRVLWNGILIGALAALARHYFPLSKK